MLVISGKRLFVWWVVWFIFSFFIDVVIRQKPMGIIISRLIDCGVFLLLLYGFCKNRET